ncbi:MAG TPA: hypothetical protein VG406_26970 [Isosphaeraceae bacterium]|jgi:hypothetical protein|nr:hypothetical protein [Isosphaeraceae bacterium]
MISPARPGRPAGVGRVARDPRRWAELAARADDPEIQRLIRRGIRAGAIRVVPGPDGGIRILTNKRRPRPAPVDRPTDSSWPPIDGDRDGELTSRTSPAPP